MSKTERRKLFQPIPLSSILDPTYQAPFSKLEKFQVDMDISSKFPQPSVWQKLQSSLLSAMSNFVIMSHPIFASSTTSFSAMSQRSTHNMSLVPWKSFKPCELLLNEDVPDSLPSSTSSTPTKSAPEKSTSLYHTVRSGLQCLRYLATHPLQCEEEELKQKTQTQTPTRHYYDCRKQNNIDLPAVGYPIAGGGGAIFFPFISTIDSTSRYSLSAPTSPVHHYRHPTSKPVASNLFSWAMSGFLLATPLHPRHLNILYNNYCLFSPMHAQGAEINAKMLCPQKSLGCPDKIPPSLKNAEGNLEIFIHSSAASQSCNVNKEKTPLCPSSGPPTNAIPVTNSPVKTGPSGRRGSNGCITIETIDWRPLNEESSDNNGSSSSSRTNFHTVSMCSSSTALKGGTFTFSCSSSMSSSPIAMMSTARTIPRRLERESESSADSFVEFSASVESTDSFCIVFESAPGVCMGGEDAGDDDEWEDDDVDDDSEEEDDDDDEDQIFNYSSNTSDDIFVDGCFFPADGLDFDGSTSACDQVDRCVNDTTSKKGHKKKTVSFDEEHLENIVEFEDDIESKSSRETYWEMLARDRARFQDRIMRTEDILEPVLLPLHRQKIFQQRFMQAENENLLN